MKAAMTGKAKKGGKTPAKSSSKEKKAKSKDDEMARKFALYMIDVPVFAHELDFDSVDDDAVF